MTALETEYSQMLTSEGCVWRYEPFRIILANRTTYLPDFLVVRDDGELELHEVKAYRSGDRSWVKLKVAASLHPWFRFVFATKRRGQWETTIVKP